MATKLYHMYLNAQNLNIKDFKLNMTQHIYKKNYTSLTRTEVRNAI